MPYDAVVVGAGVNGLAAALHLATKGWTVSYTHLDVYKRQSSD